MVIGIDSLEATLIEKHKDKLPNLARLLAESPSFRIPSIYPPDSYPAWRSIFTGLNPAEHGLLFTADVFNSAGEKISGMTNAGIEGRTFWDALSAGGQRVCVVFPLTAYPAWPVNGLFVARSEEVEGPDGVKQRNVSVHPGGAIDPVSIPNLRAFTGQHPGEAGLADFKRRAMEWAQRDADFALATAQSREWDFLFAYFMELDTIQHYFWRYCDPEDPMYAPNEHSQTILEFYRFFDALVGRFRAAFPDARLVVMSDHGHAMRPVETLNLNEALRRKGLMVARRSAGRRVLEKGKQWALRSARKMRLERVLIRAGQKVPGAKKIYTAESLVNVEESLAYLSGFRGPKSYPEGGVVINRARLGSRRYEDVRQEIMDLLASEVRRLGGSEKALAWIKRREDLYAGPHLDQYPDIVFRLGGGLGVGWDVFSDLRGKSYEHSLSSGGHSPEAVFLTTDRTVEPPRDLLDVRRYLLTTAPGESAR